MSGLVNPTALYNQYAIAGTGTPSPSTATLKNLTGSGITFVNGQPVISSSLQTSASAHTNTYMNSLATTGTSAASNPTGSITNPSGSSIATSGDTGITQPGIKLNAAGTKKASP